MKVLFAPDWRAGVPYQTLLAAALAALGVKVEFLAGYKRALALTRLVRAREFDVLHLHWPNWPAWCGMKAMNFFRLPAGKSATFKLALALPM